MAIWKKESPEDRAARQRQEREEAESRNELEKGRIPLQAQRRLGEQREQTGFFSSDLSVDEHLLARHAGYEPLGQVMGSSFYQIGYRGYYSTIYQSSGELVPLTDVQLSARNRALGRLKQEAALLGADGVIGVRLTRREPDWDDRLLEFTAIGTAVRLVEGGSTPSEEPFTSALSGQDFWKLHDAGYVPRELAFGVCSFYIHSDLQADAVLNNFWGAGMANQELRQYTAGFRVAREVAMSRFAQEVQRSGAQGAVGVDIDWECEEVEYEMNETSYLDLVVHFAAIGTAIALRREQKSSGRSTLAYYDLKDRTSFNISPKE